jgi:hypothetical protein
MNCVQFCALKLTVGLVSHATVARIATNTATAKKSFSNPIIHDALANMSPP